MKPANRYRLFTALAVVSVIFIIAVMFFFFRQQLTLSEKSFLFNILKTHYIYFFATAVILITGLWFFLDVLLNTTILPVMKVTEEIPVIHTANPSHRIRIEAADIIQKLTSAVNELASQYELSDENAKKQIQKVRVQSEREKNILAVFMQELPQGIMVCNAKGRLLFYNQKAKSYFGVMNADNSQSGFIGVGRLIFDIIDRDILVSVIDELKRKIARKDADVISRFLLPGDHRDGKEPQRHGNTRLIQAEAVSILNEDALFSGFILILRDISRWQEGESQRRHRVQTLIRQTRSSLAGIRTAIEAELDFPEMAVEKNRQFNGIIHKEALILGDILNRVSMVSSRQSRNRWSKISIKLTDVLEYLGAKIGKTVDLAALNSGNPAGECWVRVDLFSLGLALQFVFKKIRDKSRCEIIGNDISMENGFAYVDFSWRGDPVSTERLRYWEADILEVGMERLPLTLGDVLEHHAGELCMLSGPDMSRMTLRLILPVGGKNIRLPKRMPTILPDRRLEFYDFDLFHQAGQTPELAQRLLTELTYTVFDTETTGLNPKGGDKIISIGAVRMMNGRLFQTDYFDQLVDPKRSIPAASTKIHGITNDMVKNHPVIDRVLPLFYKFSEETVLVAHNAAFDMKMLQMVERETGITFSHPVLDTLLLSAVVHPGQADHGMGAISARLGVKITGRHTAMGDALSAAKLFLRMIPLLNNMNIYTLGDAVSASRKTHLAKLKY